MPYSMSIYRQFIKHKYAVIKRKKKQKEIFFILHFSTHEEVEYQAEAIPEPMDIDSQQGELKKKELQHLKPSWSKRDKKAKNYKIS